VPLGCQCRGHPLGTLGGASHDQGLADGPDAADGRHLVGGLVAGAEDGQGGGTGPGQQVDGEGVGRSGPVSVRGADLQDGRDPADRLVEQQQGGVVALQPALGVAGPVDTDLHPCMGRGRGRLEGELVARVRSVHGETGKDRAVHCRGEGGAGRFQGQVLVHERGGLLLGDVQQAARSR
jgi:hypothetical protein